MRLTWAQPEDLVPHELAQSGAEGRDVAGVAERWRAAGGSLDAPVSGAGPAPAPAPLRALARELLDELDALPTPAHPDEPDDWESIAALLPGAPGREAGGAVRGSVGGVVGGDHVISARQPDRTGSDRVAGAWTGRAAGCLLGKPVEKIPRRGIEEIARATGNWPVAGWFTAVGLPAEVATRWPWNRRSAPTSLAENIAGMPEDDDLNFPMLALDLLESYGPGFTTDDVAQIWLANLPAGRVFTAERAAYRNLLDARPIPETATFHNPFREWIGALIRADVYGWVNPGDTTAAARMAWTDARLSHTRNGVYGAMWAAALASSALVAQDVTEVLDAADAVVPPRSRLATAIALGRDVGRRARTAADGESRTGRAEARESALATGLDELHDAYGHLHWVHVLNNAATIAFALEFGAGHFTRSVGAAVTAGWDTDSVGATVGGVVGALCGAAGIPGQWSAPLDGRIATSLPGGERRITDLAARTSALAANSQGVTTAEPRATAGGAAATAEPTMSAPADEPAAPRPLGTGGRVVVVGSANVDLVVPVARHPRGGETLLGGDLRRVPGGKGANQAVAAARAGGADTTFVGALGTDDGADLLLGSLAACGVRTDLVERLPGVATGTALITVSDDGENAIVVAPGANAHARITAAAAARILAADVVLTQLETPLDVVRAAGYDKRPGTLLVLNAAPSAPLPDDVWALLDVLVVNEHEAADLTGESDPEAALAALTDRVGAVVVTLGGAGCVVARRGEAPVRLAGAEVEVVDTTGAGDTFCGVLCAALSRGEDLVAAARRAGTAGALAVTRPGAQDGVPTAAEVAAFPSAPPRPLGRVEDVRSAR